ncbi:MAG TPA: winged helix-turn-helix domain-containing protein [Bryobacteraceae bacterium]
MTRTPIDTRQACRFGPYRLVRADRMVWKGLQAVHLTPKVFDTLLILLDNRERILSKQELLETVWPDRFVEEANLTQNISVLRKALGEIDSGTKYIATFPGKGYRFIAEVEEECPDLAIGLPTFSPEAAASEASPAAQLPKLPMRFVVPGLLFLAILCLASTRWLGKTRSRSFYLGPGTVVTHLPGRVFQPAITPDGTKVAFVLHDSLLGSWRLGILDFAHGPQPYLLPAGDGDKFSPAWSPNGMSLAYLQLDGNKLKLMIRDAAGKSTHLADVFPRRYGLGSRQLDWSPDGRLIAVSDKTSAEDPFNIELIHIAEGRKIPLTRPPALSDGDLEPRFSPDGTKLAFVRHMSRDITPIYAMNLPGGDLQPIKSDSRFVGDIDWTTDSSALLCSMGTATSTSLWRIPIGKTSGIEAIERSEVIGSGPAQFSVSRKSGRLVWGMAEPQENIWRAKLDRVHGVSNWERWIASTGRNYFPVYSHDGWQVAFISERSGKTQIWTKDGDRKERQLTFGDLRPSYVSWTSDGAIVFSSLNRRRAYKIVRPDDTPTALPLPAVIGSHSAASLDGKSVYFVHRFYIFAGPVTGRQPRQLTDQGGFPLRLSPDGAWLYYVRNRFSSEIWRVNCANGRAEKVTDHLQPGFWSAWSLAGRDLIYLANNGDVIPETLERLNLDTGQTNTLGQLPGRVPAFGLAGLAVSPDEHFLLAVLAEPGSGDLRLISKPPSALTR